MTKSFEGDLRDSTPPAQAAANTVDFLLAIYEGNLVTHLDPGALGAAFYIPTAVVPPLVVAHIMSF